MLYANNALSVIRFYFTVIFVFMQTAVIYKCYLFKPKWKSKMYQIVYLNFEPCPSSLFLSPYFLSKIIK